MKSSVLRHCQACSQNIGLSEYQMRTSHLWTAPSPARGREAGGRQTDKKGTISAPEMASSTKLHAASQLLTKTSWDSGWLTSTEGRSQRSAPQKTHSTPETNQVAGMEAAIRCTPYLGKVRSRSTWSPELLGPGKGTKRRPNRVCAFVEYPRN